MSYNQTKEEKYAENSGKKVGDKLKEAKEEVFGKSEKDKTLGDKANEKLQQDKPIVEKVGDYAKNTAESAGEALKGAK